MRAILTYHSIDPSGSPISCRPDAFDRHVEWLASGRVRTTTIDELMILPDDADAVAITFDDAYVNFGDTAAPRLLDHGLPVTVFVVADLAGRTNAWDDGPARTIPALPLLDWPALVRLQERGVSLGAHSRTHADLRALPPAALDDEVLGSAAVMEQRTGRRPSVFAYPYGHTDVRCAKAVGQAFRYGCTAAFRPLQDGDDAALLPRLDMYYFQRPGALESWGRPAFTARVQARGLLRRARRIAEGITDGSHSVRTS
jgi:peptidoglycan/xylan/chitin deacetylase (PgdA/CDA1 family)